MLKPVVKRSAEDLALDAVRAYIVSGDAGLGARLTEQRLADDLGISRATVRTALHRLAVEGLVQQVAYSGWHVIRLDARDVRELFTLRAVLEGLAARLAVTHMDDSGRAELTTLWLDLVAACTANNEALISSLDFAFHETMVRLSGHRRLGETYSQIGQQIRLFIVSSNLQAEMPEYVIAEHKPLIDALLGNDPDLAAQVAESHIRAAGEKLEAWLRQQEPQA